MPSTTSPSVHYKVDECGFEYGAAHVQRIASDPKKGWVVLEVRTRKTWVQIYVTKMGKVRLFGANAKEIVVPK